MSTNPSASACVRGVSRPGARRKRRGEANGSKYEDGVGKSFVRAETRAVAAAAMVAGSGFLVGLVVVDESEGWEWVCSSSMHQSTNGSERQTPVMALGSVRARVVAREAPRWEEVR